VARLIPPLHAVEAFLFATRAVSFRAAAEELSLSPSAFSRRIQALESFLGVALYDRSGPVPRLTGAGERYWDSLSPAIIAIGEATDALRRAPAARRLRLLCPPSFAINWLMPHLRAYHDRHGEQDVDIVVGRDLDALRLGRADMAIASGPRDFSNLLSEPFLSLQGAVVSAPVLLGGRRPPRSPADLTGYSLLGLNPPADLSHDLWNGWQNCAGHQNLQLPEPIRFDTWALMYEAAANGMGVTIAVPAVSETYLRSERLKLCFDSRVDLGIHYSLLYADDGIRRRKDVNHLREWMMNTMQGSLAQYRSSIAHA
jgi:LysR family transcriptional regulator, glycine cleavage system transcriptional activator